MCSYTSHLLCRNKGHIQPITGINGRNEALWKNSGQIIADKLGVPTQKAQLLITKCLGNSLVGRERWGDRLLLGSGQLKALFTAMQVPQERMPSMFTSPRERRDENFTGTEDPGLRARRPVGLAVSSTYPFDPDHDYFLRGLRHMQCSSLSSTYKTAKRPCLL